MKKTLIALLMMTFILAGLYGCDVEYDSSEVVNMTPVYTLVEGETESYYIVGKCKELSELEITESDLNKYDFDEKAEKLGIYGGYDKTMTIPAEYNGLPVKGIGAYAFYLSGLESVNLPETIEFIADKAFSACKSLKTVSIGSDSEGSSVKEFGNGVFMNDTALLTVAIWSDYAPEVPDFDFTKNTNIFFGTNYPAVIVRDMNVQSFKADKAWLFYKDYVVGNGGVYQNGIIAQDGVFVKYAGSAKSVEVPDTVEAIGAYAFKGSQITSVTISGNVKSIGRQAFDSCTALETVSFADEGKNLEVIGINAFGGCTALKTFVLPANLSVIKDRAFYNCKALNTIYVNCVDLEIINSFAFKGCDGLKSVFFAGSEEQFAALDIREGNENLTGANIEYDYLNAEQETEPEVEPEINGEE